MPVADQRSDAAQTALRIYTLKVAGRVIAVQYALRYGAVVHGYATAFDPDFRLYSPGRIIIADAIKGAIAEGAREFNCGLGGHAYKYDWARLQRVDRHLILTRTIHGHFWTYGGTFYRRSRAAYRQYAAPALRRASGRFKRLSSLPAR